MNKSRSDRAWQSLVAYPGLHNNIEPAAPRQRIRLRRPPIRGERDDIPRPPWSAKNMNVRRSKGKCYRPSRAYPLQTAAYGCLDTSLRL